MKVKKGIILSLLLFVATTPVHGQTQAVSKKKFPKIKAERVDQIAPQLDEISGLATTDNYFWGHNDSLGESAIYAFDKKSLILKKTIYIEGATNFDWEELAQDDDFLYIADTGDNIAFRRSVDIYKVAKTDLEKSITNSTQNVAEKSSTVKSTSLKIRYAAKRNFLPTKKHNFDSEALTVVGDHLWLFTKNRLNQQTSLYKLDKKAKEQEVSAVLDLPVQGLITAADYNVDNNKLLLLGYSQHSPNWGAFIWVMNVVDQLPDWQSAKRYKIEPYGQWESIKWISDHHFVAAAEKSRHSKQILGHFKLPN